GLWAWPDLEHPLGAQFRDDARYVPEVEPAAPQVSVSVSGYPKRLLGDRLKRHAPPPRAPRSPSLATRGPRRPSPRGASGRAPSSSPGATRRIGVDPAREAGAGTGSSAADTPRRDLLANRAMSAGGRSPPYCRHTPRSARRSPRGLPRATGGRTGTPRPGTAPWRLWLALDGAPQVAHCGARTRVVAQPTETRRRRATLPGSCPARRSRGRHR